MSNLSDLLGGGGSNIKKFQLFTASGTWIRPAGVDIVYLTAIGGGGGGGLGGGAGQSFGGNGGECVQKMPVDVAGNVIISIGLGGVALTAAVDADGNVGGNTTFGALTFSGGSGGRILDVLPYNVGGGIGGSFDTQPIKCPGTSPGGIFGGPAGAMAGENGGPGGGGLVLDTTGKKGGDTSRVDREHRGGVGYGAGGGSHGFNTWDSGAGASGAVLVEWEEIV